MPRVDADELRTFIEGLFLAVKCTPRGAAVMADAFLEADLRGHSIQGLDHVHSPLRDIRSGRIRPNVEPRIVREGPAFALIDGGGGLGPVASSFAAETATAKARAAGAAAVGLLGASDIFMLAYYAEKMARAGVVGFTLTNSPALVHACGGTEAVMGTNPFAVGFPVAGGDPIVFDTSTSIISAGLVRIAAYEGATIPAGVAVDAEGRPTQDARAMRAGGAIAPFGGAKGFGLGLIVGFISGPLVGGGLGRAIQGWVLGHGGGGDAVAPRGHFFIAVDPAAFGDPGRFQDAVANYAGQLMQSRTAPGADRIRLPGERAHEHRARSLEEGVPIRDSVWRNTAEVARELGVPLPSARF